MKKTLLKIVASTMILASFAFGAREWYFSQRIKEVDHLMYSKMSELYHKSREELFGLEIQGGGFDAASLPSLEKCKRYATAVERAEEQASKDPIITELNRQREYFQSRRFF